MFRITFFMVTALAVTACGGGKSQENTEGNFDVQAYEKLRLTNIEAKALRPASTEELERHLKNGIRLNVANIWYSPLDGSPTPSPAATAAPSADADFTSAESEAGAQAQGNYSSTNTHIQGVDEADFLKYDGRYIYVVQPQRYDQDSGQSDGQIRILETDAVNAGVTEIASIETGAQQWSNLSELYLLSSNETTRDLVTIRSSAAQFGFPEPLLIDDFFEIWPAENKSEIEIKSYNVEDPANPHVTMTLDIDGRLHTSRRINNTLYLVSHFTPRIDDTARYIYSEQEALENEAKIDEATLEDLLPTYRLNGEEETLIASAEDCLVPVDLDPDQGFHNIVTIVAVDLEGQQITSTQCLNTRVSGIYANQDELYLGGSRYQPATDDWLYDSFTVVHKFELDTQIGYRSTGIVPGTLGWRDPAFRMDAHDNALRVVTSYSGGDGNRHQLNILEDEPDSDLMNILATLPNDEQPAPIGKPNEEIFAVRFMGDRAFVVTFQRTDPLYIIDLSNHNPSIAGELEVPGFSTYLHPVDNDYLLGIGREADDAGVAQGIKVSLFDISDSSSPLLINSETFGERGSDSSALHDLRAVSFLRTNDDQLRFTLPVRRLATDWEWLDDGLYLFEINGLTESSADLAHVGQIISESLASQDPQQSEWRWSPFSHTDRGVLHGESVFYSHRGQIWASFWGSPGAATGPH